MLFVDDYTAVTSLPAFGAKGLRLEIVDVVVQEQKREMKLKKE